MKGVSYLTDENNRRKAVVIELSALEQYEDDLEDLLDGLLAEARREGPKLPLADVIANLQKSGKL